MQRNELIKIAFYIKENPNNDIDYSSVLYSAVGLIKRQNDLGTLFAAQLLVDAIKKSSRNLSDFCVRKISIIEEAYAKKYICIMAKMYEYEELCQARRGDGYF